MRKNLLAVLLCSFLLGVPSAWADNHQPPLDEETPQELLNDAANRLVRALELILMAIPQYSSPEMLENGDIIIRRVWPEGEGPDGVEQPKEILENEKKI